MTDEQQEPAVDVEALQKELAEMRAERAARALEDTRKAAIAKYEIPANLHQFVQSTDEKSFEASAQAVAEAFKAQQPAAPPDPAFAAYGNPIGTPGSPVGGRSPQEERRDLIAPTLAKIRNDQPLSKQEAQQFVKIVGNHAMQSLVDARRAGQGR